MILLSQDAAFDIERVREFLDINNPEAAKRALRVIFAAFGCYAAKVERA